MSKSAKSVLTLRLSDTQLIALSGAAQREDGVIAVYDRLKGAAAQKFMSTLIEKGLAREVRAKPGMSVARRDEDGRAVALVVTKQGRATVHVDDDEADEAPAKESSRSKGQEDGASAKVSPTSRSPKPGENVERASTGKGGSLAPTSDSRPREGSKLAAVIGLLARPDGASLDELIAATAWLPHTTRAALTGLRKRGYAVDRRRLDGKTRYEIAAPDAADAA
jgi:hypothetical protein